jgi:predicted butyrate kinase (DUF1464 family)
MTEKRMLIVDSELVEKIDQNRGDMTQAQFINFLIDKVINNEPIVSNDNHYLEREEFQKFTQEMKDLLRRFLDFFMSYGMQVGEDIKSQSIEELSQKLQLLANNGSKHKIGR